MNARFVSCLILMGGLLGLLAMRPQPSLRVLIFLETECPISQKTTSRFQALADTYADRVMFEAIYPTETVTVGEVEAFEKAYSFRVPRRLDPRHRLVKRYKATTTPEVILLDARDRILYRGSVDDQFYKLGKYRPSPTVQYLRDALEATLHGQPVPVARVTPVGCLINYQ
ncbi:redoxin domain-containing protein [Spirosoma utsteinense]|uniref:Thiol-disulfide isomerase/thioredoxin n=1 Tax=Spirosoma utsteinense TaxID=2585773 RepID=A0ABR6WD04_9BACT|nr:redoxin domain-containing protein [Spirosoma utsteinense]MBC3787473.1 thiol-disulfide isomerase/thioredoxin [Spirosoma utsteinense]MBC3794409.1 thiol-disulfide isomerase/thioredoxin [Spirosoma utsteinense]